MKYEKFVKTAFTGTIGGGLCRPVEVEKLMRPAVEDIIKEYETIADNLSVPIEYSGPEEVRFTALPENYFTLKLNELVTMDVS